VAGDDTPHDVQPEARALAVCLVVKNGLAMKCAPQMPLFKPDTLPQKCEPQPPEAHEKF
jgi:hypothetical protein